MVTTSPHQIPHIPFHRDLEFFIALPDSVSVYVQARKLHEKKPSTSIVHMPHREMSLWGANGVQIIRQLSHQMEDQEDIS